MLLLQDGFQTSETERREVQGQLLNEGNFKIDCD